MSWVLYRGRPDDNQATLELYIMYTHRKDSSSNRDIGTTVENIEDNFIYGRVVDAYMAAVDPVAHVGNIQAFPDESINYLIPQEY